MARPDPSSSRPASSGPPLAINGFRDDVSVLISAFLQKNSFRLQSFVDVWEEMKFGFIFGGLPPTLRGMTEIHEFAEKCFKEALILCLPPNESLNRVAGLYLLYCLYISRPLHCHAKIRIHPKTEMSALLLFMEELVQHIHYDTVYCFLELYEQNAFCYTLTTREMGSHTQRSKIWRDDSNIKMYIPEIPKLLTSDTISKLLDAASVYTETKSELLKDPEQCVALGVQPSQFNYVQADFREQLQKVSDDYVTTMQNLYNNPAAEGKLGPDDEPSSSATNGEDSSIGQRRRRLRQSQMTRSVTGRAN